MTSLIKKHIINLLLLSWLLILYTISGEHLNAEGSATNNYPQAHSNSCQGLATSPTTMRYRINWQMLPAGTIEITATQNAANEAETPVIRYDMLAKSLPQIDPIYPVRISATSEVDTASLLPIRYIKDSKEGWGKKRYSDLHFNYEKNTVISYAKDREPRHIVIRHDTLDPLCAIFIARTRLCELKRNTKKTDGKPDGTISFSITDGKKVANIEIKQIGTETVETDIGKFKTKVYSLEMDNVSGLFSKKRGAKIYLWLSEENFMPVRIKSEAVVGAFTATLVSVGDQLAVRITS